MTNPYTSVTVTGYNDTPPSDDGSQTSANQLKWSTHKTKLGDPLNSAIASINGNVLAAFATEIKNIQNGAYTYKTSTGSGNAYVLTLDDPPTAYVAGQLFTFKANLANTGVSTLNINGLGAKQLTKNGTTELVSGDIPLAAVVTVVYDGAVFQLLNPTGNYVSGPATSTDVSPVFWSGATGKLVRDGGSAGTAGQVLTSNGPAAIASFQAIPSAPGRLLSFQVFTVAGANTWTKPAGVNKVLVEVQGAGGGGGGIDGLGVRFAAGGGGGGFSRKWITAPGATETATVGAGGTAGANTGGNGGTGGTSSFGAWASATGGAGGGGQTSTIAAAGGAGGIGSSGDLNIAGGPGEGAVGGLTAAQSLSGNGGNSFMGGGARGTPNNSAGAAGGQYGGGASGAAGNSVAAVGGVGAGGVIVVWEYS